MIALALDLPSGAYGTYRIIRLPDAPPEFREPVLLDGQALFVKVYRRTYPVQGFGETAGAIVGYVYQLYSLQEGEVP